MKKRYLLFIFIVSVMMGIIAPSKYETKLTWNGLSNVDSFMETGNYYFMCKPEFGFLINKTVPKLKTNEIDFFGYDYIAESQIREYIKYNPSWRENAIYKFTEIMDSNTISSNVYTIDFDENQTMVISNSKNKSYLYLIDKKINKDSEIMMSRYELISLAKKRCKQ